MEADTEPVTSFAQSIFEKIDHPTLVMIVFVLFLFTILVAGFAAFTYIHLRNKQGPPGPPGQASRLKQDMSNVVKLDQTLMMVPDSEHKMAFRLRTIN